MDPTAAFDILNSTNSDDELWDDAFDCLREHGYSWTLTSSDASTRVIDMLLDDLTVSESRAFLFLLCLRGGRY
jgi:hypothetical protein